MATQSTIEWTEQTWNPTTGCTKVSPGCKHCYAEVMARRLHAMGASGYENEFTLTLHENRLEQPLARKKPTVYFVNSMSDLFHEDVTRTWIAYSLSLRPRRITLIKFLPSELNDCQSISRTAPARRTCGWECRWRTRSTACRASITCARWMRTFAFSPSSLSLKTWAESTCATSTG